MNAIFNKIPLRKLLFLFQFNKISFKCNTNESLCLQSGISDRLATEIKYILLTS